MLPSALSLRSTVAALTHRLSTLPLQPLPPRQYRHYASASHTPSMTTTTTTATAATAATAATTPLPPPHEKLSWDSFLRLRTVRRRYNLVSSMLSSMLGTTGGIGYLANKEIDPTQTIMGMDPLMMFGLATLSCGAAGWLVGPVMGSTAFRVMNAKYMVQISEREQEFLQHIKKNRVDPSFQSFSNPVPDYYGEKIGSVRQYRQWLKDQRAYNRKSKNFL